MAEVKKLDTRVITCTVEEFQMIIAGLHEEKDRLIESTKGETEEDLRINRLKKIDRYKMLIEDLQK